MPLTPIRFLKKLFDRRKNMYPTMTGKITVPDVRCCDFAGKIVYWCPPWAVNEMQHMGKSKIIAHDPINNLFYYDKPVPLCVEEGWFMVILDA
jgi:hypothetical protein